MARSASGTILVKVGPEFKEELYSTISRAGMTMKEWIELYGQVTIENGSDKLAKLHKNKAK